MNAWGVVVIALGAGLLYWAAKHAATLPSLGSITGAAAKAVANGAGGALGPTLSTLTP